MLSRFVTKSKGFWESSRMMFLLAIDVANGQTLYKHQVEYETTEYSTDSSGGTETVAIDETFVLPHPTRDLFVTHSNHSLKLFDTRTGQLLQDVIPQQWFLAQPSAPGTSTGLRKHCGTTTVRTLVTVSEYGVIVSFWELEN